VAHAVDQLSAQVRSAAADALAAQRAGKKPTREQSAALRKVQAAQSEQSRAEAYAAVPKKDWRRWAGCQHKVLDDHAANYGAPIEGKAIDLAEFVRWFHGDHLAEVRRLRAESQGGSDDPKYRLAEINARLKQLDLDARQGRLLDRHHVHQGLSRMAALLRRAGEALQREHPGAERILNDALEDFTREVDRLFDDDDDRDDG